MFWPFGSKHTLRTVTVTDQGGIYRGGSFTGLCFLPDVDGNFAIRPGSYEVRTEGYRDWQIVVYRSRTGRALVIGGTTTVVAVACRREWRKFWGGRDPYFLYIRELNE